MKKIIILILIILITSGCTSQDNKIDYYKTNNNIDVISEKQYENIKIDNISVLYKDNLSTFSFNITNTGSDEIFISRIDAYFKVANNDILTTLSDEINGTLQAGESTEVNIVSDIDLTRAVKLEFSIK